MDSAFLLPPVVYDAKSRVRTVGFEYEYTGLSVAKSADLVQEVFGGERIHESTFLECVRTRLGSFKCELDLQFVKDKKHEKALAALGIHLDWENKSKLENMLLGVASTVAPLEIATPPVPMNELEQLEEITRRLRRQGAKGTRASVLYAFGLHINAEIPSDDPEVLLSYLRAVMLLYPWLKEQSEVSFTRSVSPFVKPFSTQYARLILAEDYPISKRKLIDDYLEHNPTRNRPLDMLPILAYLDEEYVMKRVEEPKMVTARPAFHYRLPNSMVDEPDWTLASEWNRWVEVEKLACDRQRLAEMSREFEKAEEQSFRPFIDKWPDVLQHYMGA